MVRDNNTMRKEMQRVNLDDVSFQRIAKAMSDPHRIHIMRMLTQNGRLNCRMMVDRLSLAQATVSHHLKELVNAEVLDVTPEGAYNYYTLRRETVDAYSRALRERFLVESDN